MAGLCEGGKEPPGSLKAIYGIFSAELQSENKVTAGKTKVTFRNIKINLLESFPKIYHAILNVNILRKRTPIDIYMGVVGQRRLNLT
ncbi:hypothetical protein ANN_06199 [Periplaneta americana]|uniref:Uncharacterized protein n=1 Tax=Periplaneta americana TaxID=6978 RepID=A0ABQ8TF62_PERAM|nr:hypothetical protein ANN_06199 [Periplaneta americana]